MPAATRSTFASSRSGCAATGRRSCSTSNGVLDEELAALAPRSYRRMGANPHANGGLLLRDLDLPDFRAYAVGGGQAGRRRDRGHAAARPLAAGRDQAQSGDVPAVRPGRDGLQPAPGRVRGDEPGLRRGDLPHRRPPGPGRPGDGGAVGAPVRGLAGGLPADRPARAVQLLRGVHPHRRLDVQPARQVAGVLQPDRMAPAGRLAELPAVQPGVAAGPQRVLAPGPRLPRRGAEQAGRGRPGLPAAGREHACCRWATIACARATTSTSSSRASSRSRTGCR